MRNDAFLLAWAAADEAGPMDPLSEAEFILRRLYPEMSEEQLAFVRADLGREQAAGRWHGFVRPEARSG